ncbi:MAG: oxidoreductase [Saprospiraceae bacterium]|nr:oxidoreductase [Saprospiraceae bacterium]
MSISRIIIVICSISISAALWFACGGNADKTEEMKDKPVTLMNVDPGHFHAALVQKDMYPEVSETVYVYAPDGPEVDNHLGAIEGYNTRPERPTSWNEKVYRGSDFFEKMLSEKPGNVMIVSGNNAKKTNYIHRAVSEGINVLADKPMVISPDHFPLLVEAFDIAKGKGVLLYDIMTERFEVTTGLQKSLSQMPEVFGALEVGTLEDPAITKESVHHYSKMVSGKPLKRPAWFFDVAQQGEGIVDVTTHLVDLVFWECYPSVVLDYQKDIELASARRWPTEINPAQFEKVTQLSSFPDYLQPYVVRDSILEVYANGEIVFKVKDTYAKVSVIWNYEAPPGAKDTHYSIMRGTTANLVIRQGKDQGYQATLYVEPHGEKAELKPALQDAIKRLSATYTGLSFVDTEQGWEIKIPATYKVGHEAHFAQVTDRYLEYLEAGKMPAWEVPNMIAKYYVTTEGYKLAKK